MLYQPKGVAMKKLIASLFLLLVSMSAFATDPYNANGAVFPDETTYHNLPSAIPCVTSEYNQSTSIKCTWLAYPREVSIYNNVEQRNILYSNQFNGRCIRGKCKSPAGDMGAWPHDVDFTLSIWYYIGESSDGRPVAYRIDGGPQKGDRPVSYAEAGRILYAFYQDAGVSKKLFKATFDRQYQGGLAAFMAEKGQLPRVATPQKVSNVRVDKAWCNPQLDDDCSINGKKVLKRNLKDFLPVVDEGIISANGGYCEYPICYDGNDKPVGIRSK